MYIGIISDTHGVFDEGFRKFLEPVDVIWHAGDFGGGIEFAQQIASFKPLIGVYGNCDGQDIRMDYPQYQDFECEGKRVLMTHIGGYPGHYDLRAKELIELCKPDIFVCGHSHILKVGYDDRYNMLDINPGACGVQGWHVFRTALRLHIDSGKVHDMELYKLARAGK